VYSSPDIIGLTKSRRIRWSADVALMGKQDDASRRKETTRKT
jgi:hypothetical protein